MTTLTVIMKAVPPDNSKAGGESTLMNIEDINFNREYYA